MWIYLNIQIHIKIKLINIRYTLDLLVDPVLGVAGPVQYFAFPEPKSNFLLGVFNRVGSVTDVATNFDTEISTDGTFNVLILRAN